MADAPRALQKLLRPWCTPTGAARRSRLAHRSSPTWRQRALGLVILICGCSAARADVPVGLQVGYAFRPATPTGEVIDDRFHGASGALTVDAPPVLFGFSGRLEALVLAWPGGPVAADPLLVAVAVPSLTYRFDDTGPKAIASVGPAVGVRIDGDDVVTTIGVQAALVIRLPMADGVDLDARVGAGWLDGVGLDGTAMIGLSVSPDRLIARAVAGEGPEAIAREVAPTFLPAADPPADHVDDADVP